MNPTEPITAWILVTFAVTTVVVGMPLLIGLLSFRRQAREGREKDTAALVTPLIAAQIKTHNEEKYAHPDVLARYVLEGTLNASLATIRSEIVSVGALSDASLATLRAEIGFVRSMIEQNEKQRQTDVDAFKKDMEQLKKNVAAAVGKRGDEL